MMPLYIVPQSQNAKAAMTHNAKAAMTQCECRDDTMRQPQSQNATGAMTQCEGRNHKTSDVYSCFLQESTTHAVPQEQPQISAYSADSPTTHAHHMLAHACDPRSQDFHNLATLSAMAFRTAASFFICTTRFLNAFGSGSDPSSPFKIFVHAFAAATMSILLSQKATAATTTHPPIHCYLYKAPTAFRCSRISRQSL